MEEQFNYIFLCRTYVFCCYSASKKGNPLTMRGDILQTILVKNEPDIFRIKSRMLSPLNGSWRLNAVDALQRNFDLCIPRKGTARPQSRFSHACVCERFIYSRDRSTYFPSAEYRGNIQKAHRNMNV